VPRRAGKRAERPANVGRGWLIAFIDRITMDSRHALIENVEFGDERIHDAPPI
jgi:hypothetical protein